MKILFIGPLPPPINGHSLVCKVLHDSLSEKNTLATVDLKKQGLKDGKVSPTRIFEIFRVFIETWKKKKNADVVYFTISESLAGNLKDILIYIICYSILSKFFIHLHGGSIKKLLFDKYPILFSINRFFIKKIGGIIISGRSHLEIFDAYFSLERISIIPNFAPNYMFLSESGFRKKFDDKTKKIRLLFLSNMISQ
ncbi:MAG: glycosyl transferase, partial [Leptospira sp.]|nr:glycosyl transferase [Leptospira sp.]